MRDKYNYHKDPDDGSFYIGWVDFMKYFNGFRFCRINPKYVHTNYKIQSPSHKSTYLKVKVIQKGVYNFSVYQMNERKFKK